MADQKLTASNDLDTYLDALASDGGVQKVREAVSTGVSKKKTLLLLTCIDLRYPALIHAKMEPRFHKLYDHVCLAGAGLAPVVDFGPDRKPHWQQTFLEHVAISAALHSISRIMVMDHRDCGAYRKFGLLKEEDNGTSKETKAHQRQFKRLQRLLAKEFPKLSLDYLLLHIEPEAQKSKTDATVRVPIELFGP